MSDSNVRYDFGYNRMTRVVGLLIAVNAVIYFLGSFGVKEVMHWCWLDPSSIQRGYIWQLFTYMFLHGNFLHLFFNMFALWMFGCEIERSWGWKAFLRYYVITGVGAGILTFLVSLYFSPNIPTIGASGAVFGILVAYALMFPNRLIYIWFVLPVKAKYLVAIFALLTFIASFRQPQQGGIAHFAHLGGMLIGYVYLRAKRSMARVASFVTQLKYERRLKKQRQGRQGEEDILEQVDVILDKINASGMGSLTSREKKILEKASHLLSKR